MYTNVLPSGAEVLAEFANELDSLEDPASINYTTLTNAQIQGTGEEIPMVNVIDRWLIPKLTLTSSADNTQSPEVYSYSYRAFPEPEDVIARIPVNVSDRIERPGKRAKNIPGIGNKLFNALKRLEGKSVILNIYKPEETIRGIVENITLPVQEITKLGSTMVFCTIQIRGQRQNIDTSEVSSLGSLGVGQLGVYEFGV